MSINDPQWGRNAGGGKSGDAGDDDPRGKPERPDNEEQSPRNDRADEARDERRPDPPQRGRGEPTSDLDQLWDDFNRMLGSIMGGGGKNRRPGNAGWQQDRDDDSRSWNSDAREDASEDRQPQTRRSTSGFGGFGGRGGRRGNAGGRGFSARGLVLLAGVAVIGWAASGIYIVPEGQVGVVTTFGRYTSDSAAGINWRAPWPIQEVEIVDVSSVRKAEIGIKGTSSRLREALMLTDDENIVDVQFNVQYRIHPHQAKDYLFRSRDPDQAVIGAAESAMREVVGRKTMDSVLFESKQEIASNVQTIMQQMLDRYQTGIEVMSVAIQNAQPPQPVQAAFNDAVKAGQDRERSINLGEAYMNAVIPKAEGTASRLKEEAAAYKARVVETARGDADRFASVFEEYRKAPEVTRDRLYIDAMRDVYRNVTKVVVDAKGGNNLLYLPLDKIVSQTKSQAQTEAAGAVLEPAPTAAEPAPAASGTPSSDARPRDLIRNRGR